MEEGRKRGNEQEWERGEGKRERRWQKEKKGNKKKDEERERESRENIGKYGGGRNEYEWEVGGGTWWKLQKEERRIKERGDN